MKYLTALAVLLLVAGTAAAQNRQPQEQMPDHQDSNSKGTAPEGTGSTGWTGGLGQSRVGIDPTTDGSGTPSKKTADGMPYVASGSDLKGAAVRFPPNQTPE
jgi:opacity protein-like surface antigen